VGRHRLAVVVALAQEAGVGRGEQRLGQGGLGGVEAGLVGRALVVVDLVDGVAEGGVGIGGSLVL
jgi:hypothetical protein